MVLEEREGVVAGMRSTCKIKKSAVASNLSALLIDPALNLLRSEFLVPAFESHFGYSKSDVRLTVKSGGEEAHANQIEVDV